MLVNYFSCADLQSSLGRGGRGVSLPVNSQQSTPPTCLSQSVPHNITKWVVALCCLLLGYFVSTVKVQRDLNIRILLGNSNDVDCKLEAQFVSMLLIISEGVSQSQWSSSWLRRNNPSVKLWFASLSPPIIHPQPHLGHNIKMSSYTSTLLITVSWPEQVIKDNAVLGDTMR